MADPRIDAARARQEAKEQEARENRTPEQIAAEAAAEALRQEQIARAAETDRLGEAVGQVNEGLQGSSLAIRFGWEGKSERGASGRGLQTAAYPDKPLSVSWHDDQTCRIDMALRMPPDDPAMDDGSPLSVTLATFPWPTSDPEPYRQALVDWIERLTT